MAMTINTSSFLTYFEHLDSSGWVDINLDMQHGTSSTKLLLFAKNKLEHDQFMAAGLSAKNRDNNQTQHIRNDFVYWINPTDTTENPDLSYFNSTIEALRQELRDYYRFPIDHFEYHFARYPIGHYYQIHSDQKKQDNKRYFSFAYYLNPAWSNEDKGELIIYKDFDGQEVSYIKKPEAGTLLLFKSHLPHEVKPTARERWSLTGWMRTV